MAVAIRLRREGALNRPYFKVVVTDTCSPRDGKFIEIVGTYDPKKAGQNSTLKLDRIEHWISKKTKNPEAAAKKAAAAAAKKAVPAPKPAPAPAAPVAAEPLEPAAAPSETTAPMPESEPAPPSES